MPAEVSAEMREYLHRIAWEIATGEECVGMGGLTNGVPAWTFEEFGDLMPNWTLTNPDTGGGTGPVDPGGEPPEFAMSATAADFSAFDSWTGNQPLVSDGLMTFQGGDALTGPLPLPSDCYMVFSGRPTERRNIVQPVMGAAPTATSEWWAGGGLWVMYNGFTQQFGGVENYPLPASALEWVVFELWSVGTMQYAQISVRQNGVWTTGDVASREVGARAGTGYLRIAPDNLPPMQIAAIGVCDFVPDAEGRSGARAWARDLIPAGGGGA